MSTAAHVTLTSPAAESSRGWLGRVQWVYLIYLGNVVWQPAFDPTDGVAIWALTLTTVVAFLPLYALSYHPRPRLRSGALFATVGLGTLATLFNVGASVLLVYAAAMAAQRDRRFLLRWLIGLSLLIACLAVVSPVPFPYRLWGVAPSLVFVWIVGFAAREQAERDREAERLRIDSARAEQLAAAAERERISRDLHDLLGQTLTGLVVRAQLVQSLAQADPGAVVAELQQIEASARAALAQVRAAVSGLREVSLDDELSSAGHTLAAVGVEAVVDVSAASDPGPLLERCLALALREAVTNVVRHAGASRCTISLRHEDDLWRLEVTDDGVGGAAAEGNGLRGMRERIAALGGVVERRSGLGTTLVVSVPT